jgi:hypothetical protein
VWALLFWIPLALSLSNFVPVTKFHWIFEANRELFFFYLLHHLVAIGLLISRKYKHYKITSMLLALPVSSYLSVVSLPLFDSGEVSDVVITLSEPTEADPDGIQISPIDKFVELPDLDPGNMVRIGKVTVNSKSVVLVVVNIKTPWSKFNIFERKVLLRRIGSIFRHPPHEDSGPALLVGNFGAGPLSWDFQQFWREDDFEMIPLSLDSGLGLPSLSHWFLARRGVADLLVKKEGQTLRISILKD